MKFKNLIYILSILVSSNLVFSQEDQKVGDDYRNGLSNILNAKTPADIGKRTPNQINADERKPLEYGHVDDKDILWSVMVWEAIDLDQRVNFPLLYPTELDFVGRERKPMLWYLRQEIEAGNITVYDRGLEYGQLKDPVIDEEEISTLFKTKENTETGNEKLENFEETIDDIIQKERDILKFNPYLPNEIPEPRKAQIDSFTIFPYIIKLFLDENNESNYEEIDSIITYDDYQNFKKGQGVVTTNPITGERGLGELSEIATQSYIAAFAQMIEEDIFVEEEDFEYIELEYDDLKQWWIKGLWYFDKKYSELIYRPIAFAPVTGPKEIIVEEEIDIEELWLWRNSIKLDINQH
jgi:hypothetical protein